MRISDLLDVIEDDTVPIREREIAASERIKEITMEKINMENNAVKEGGGRAGKKLGKGAVIAVAAAVCLLLTVTAFAAGFMNRMVNWQGDRVDVAVPMPTPMPTEHSEAAQMEERIDQAISDAVNREQGRDLVIARYGEHGAAPQRIETLGSVDQLRELLALNDTSLSVPFSVPEGYAFLTGYVSYELAAGYEYVLNSSETTAEGVVVERYTAPEDGDFISGYMLLLANAAGEELMLRGEMLEDSEHMVFGFGDTEKVSKVEVRGMDDALVIENGEYTALHMRTALEKPVAYTSPMEMINEHAGAVNMFDGIVYVAGSAAFDGDALLALLGH